MATVTEEEPTGASEAADPEVPQARREEPTADQQAEHAALERAVAELPAVPGRDEFLTLCQMARVMAGSGMVPKALRDKPADVLVVLMTGRDLGIPVTAALRKVHPIDGQPSIAPQLKLSLIRKKGLGRVVPHPHNDRLVDRQGAVPLGPGGSVEWNRETDEVTVHGALGETYWYTWDDAIRAGLVRSGCTPDQHTSECDAAKRNRNVYQTNDVGVANFCKDNWRKNPRRLLWQRASGFCADDYFSEATLGLYDPDELGAILDDDGQLIDANHVEMPTGFGGGSGAAGSGNGGGDDSVPVDPETAWAIQLRVYALPEDAQAEFKDRWAKAKMTGTIRTFPAEKQRLVDSFLRGVEQQWKAQGKYDPDAGPGELAENVVAPCVAAALGMPPGTPKRERLPEGSEDAAAAPTEPAAPEAAEAPEVPEQPASAAEPAALPLDGPPPDPLDHPLLSIPDGVRTASDIDKTEWTIAYAKQMRLAEADTLLRHFERSTAGTPNERRARLAAALATALGVPGMPAD